MFHFAFFLSQLPRTPPAPPSAKGRTLSELEGSTTKYQHLPKDDDSSGSSSDSDGEDEEKTLKHEKAKPTEGEAEATQGEVVRGKKLSTYVDLDFVGATPDKPVPQIESGRGNYAKIDYSKQPPPPPPPVPPHITVQQATISAPPGPPRRERGWDRGMFLCTSLCSSIRL